MQGPYGRSHHHSRSRCGAPQAGSALPDRHRSSRERRTRRHAWRLDERSGARATDASAHASTSSKIPRLTRSAEFGCGRYWGPVPLAGLPTTLLYSANSDGEQIISLTSKLGGFNLKRNLLRATQGFVYIFGSSIVMESSSVS